MSHIYEIITILTLILVFTSSVFSSLIVNTNGGKIRGFESNSILDGKKYYSFLGIPYAKPPLGDLRFQPPIPAEKWEGTLNAEKEGNSCVQSDLISDNFKLIGDEDCLYLNIYTPQPPSEIKVPKAVMVWIHGGGFHYCSGSREWGASDYLMKYDVIHVTLNYRLHAFGFLNLGSRNASGNYGLKDQWMALKWVQENIGEFGGDAKNVTIFGESSGGASVQFHTISPLSKGLFQRAIIQSGYVLSQWAFNPKPIEWGFLLAKILGFKGSGNEEAGEFLKKQPADKITKAVHTMQQRHKNEYHQSVFSIFIPSVEIIKENAFLPDTPENLVKTMDNIPIMIGFVEHEGAFELLEFKNIWETENKLISTVKYYFDGIDDSHLDDIVLKIKKYYFGNKEIPTDVKLKLLEMWDDLETLHFYETIEKLSDSPSPPYVYKFTHNGDLHIGKDFFSLLSKLDINGTIHSDELSYLFYIPTIGTNSIDFKPNDLKIIHQMCSLWTNFAKTGNPTYNVDVKWEPSTTSKPTYLEISLDPKLVEDKIRERGRSFWVELIKSENLPFRNSKYLYDISKLNETILATSDTTTT